MHAGQGFHSRLGLVKGETLCKVDASITLCFEVLQHQNRVMWRRSVSGVQATWNRQPIRLKGVTTSRN